MYLQLGVVFLTVFQIVITEKCVTPNNEDAECVSIYSCKILHEAVIEAVFNTEQSESIEFVRKSKCGMNSDRMVCCGSTSQFMAPTINKNANKSKLIPDRRYCGYQHSDDYFRNETTIGINEFPWLAGLLYKFPENITIIGCTGCLISNRYVLTAAHCFYEPNNRHNYLNWPSLAGVLLGEYNRETADDCIEDSSFYECSDAPQQLDIEKIIPHPQFDSTFYIGGRFVHDIGLLRLSKKIRYSDYIRPICLPTAGTMFAKPGDTLLTSGWGEYSFSRRTHIDLKKKIYSELITNEECAAALELYSKVKNVNHLCAKELENNTEYTSKENEGAPVIFSFRKQWHQEGVLSFATTNRLMKSEPVVYTKVVDYLDWIIENIEP